MMGFALICWERALLFSFHIIFAVLFRGLRVHRAMLGLGGPAGAGDLLGALTPVEIASLQQGSGSWALTTVDIVTQLRDEGPYRGQNTPVTMRVRMRGDEGCARTTTVKDNLSAGRTTTILPACVNEHRTLPPGVWKHSPGRWLALGKA